MERSEMKMRIFVINNNGHYEMNWCHFVEAPADFEPWFDQIWVPWQRQVHLDAAVRSGRRFDACPTDGVLEVDELVGVLEKISWRQGYGPVNELCSYHSFLGYDLPESKPKFQGPLPQYTPGWQNKGQGTCERRHCLGPDRDVDKTPVVQPRVEMSNGKAAKVSLDGVRTTDELNGCDMVKTFKEQS